MADTKKLTATQERLLVEIGAYGLRRRTGRGPTQHWVATTGQRAHIRSVDALFAVHYLRVASLGVEDVIEIADAGRAYLEERAA